METQITNASLLAEMVRNRLTQLGVSRRQFCMNNNISRQTLYEIEHQGKTNLMPTTLAAIDSGCHWPPGTAARYAVGDQSAGNSREDWERIHEYMHRIIHNISLMTVDELERESIWLEEELFGRNSLNSADHIDLIRDAIRASLPPTEQGRSVAKPKRGNTREKDRTIGE